MPNPEGQILPCPNGAECTWEIFPTPGNSNTVPLLLLLGILAVLPACRKESATTGVSREHSGSGERQELPLPADDEWFVNITEAAGIHARQNLPGSDIKTIVESVGVGAAFSDLDGDGWLDLLVLGGPNYPGAEHPPARKSRIHVYRNQCDGGFTEITSETGFTPDITAITVAVADVDGDGDRDVYLADYGRNRLFINDGGFRFHDGTKRAGVGDPHYGVAAVFFDLENDGDMDLYVGNYLEYESLGTPFYAPDGHPGPLEYKPQPDTLYRNRGDGTFDDISRESGIASLQGRAMSLATGDFNRDGFTDIFVANDAGANFLFRNTGSGRFTEVGLMSGVALGQSGENTSAMACDIGDMDRDGLLDLMVSDTSYGAYYRQYEPGQFEDWVMSSGLASWYGQYITWGQVVLDFDNDGDSDIFSVNGGMKHLVPWEDLLLANDGKGRFEEIVRNAGSYFQEQHVGRGTMAGDYDNDGDIDLFVTHLNENVVLLRNDTPRGNSWLTLDLVGKKSRDAFGAKVTIRAANQSWVAESRCPSGYLTQGDPRLHFGFGPDVELLDEIRIQWPSGKETLRTEVSARQILRVEVDP